MLMKLKKNRKFKRCHEWKSILKVQKTVLDLQNSLFIYKIFANSKNYHAFQKMFVNFKNCPPNFQKLFSILEMFADSRKLFKYFTIFLNVCK